MLGHGPGPSKARIDRDKKRLEVLYQISFFNDYTRRSRYQQSATSSANRNETEKIEHRAKQKTRMIYMPMPRQKRTKAELFLGEDERRKGGINENNCLRKRYVKCSALLVGRRPGTILVLFDIIQRGCPPPLNPLPLPLPLTVPVVSLLRRRAPSLTVRAPASPAGLTLPLAVVTVVAAGTTGAARPLATVAGRRRTTVVAPDG